MIDADTIKSLQGLHRKAQLELWHVEEGITQANVSRTNGAEHLRKTYRDSAEAIAKLTELNALIAQTIQ